MKIEIKILFSVGGMGGRNLPNDVITIQQALNNVWPVSGGPSPSLVVDSICGQKTINAIKKFQIHHFGWSGADGRVDPTGQTLRKLNEIHNSDHNIHPNKQALPDHTTMLCPHGGKVMHSGSKHGVEYLMAEDDYVVSGCAYHFGGVSPCVKVHWILPERGLLTRESRGICLSAKQRQQGFVIIMG